MVEILFIALFFYGLAVLLGYGLGLVFGLFAILCQIFGWIVSKIAKKIPVATKEPAISKPMTAKEKLELTVGLIAMGYTALLIGVAVFTTIPTDLIIAVWLIMTAVASVLAHKKLDRITHQQSS